MQKLINVVAVGFTIFILGVIYAANTGISLQLFHIKQLPMGDKIAHFSLLGMLTFLLNWAFQGKLFTFKNRKWLVVSAFILVGCTMEEFSQMFIPTRNFDLLDLTANYLGILTASWLYLRWFGKSENRHTDTVLG